MPRDLFGSVSSSSRSRNPGTRLTSPLSMAVHVAALTALVVAPLVATSVLPAPRSLLQAFVDAPAIPPEPPPTPVAPQPVQPPANPNVPPLQVPETITPEPLVARLPDPVSIDTSTVAGITTSIGEVLSIAEPPPPTPPARAPVRVGGMVTAPRKLVDVAPTYPPIAQQAHVEGLVIIQATIGIDGRVVDATVLRPAPLFEQAALEAVRQWRYSPTRLNGEPVEVVMTVTLAFRLR